MDEIFKQYGGPIITVTIIVALLVIVGALLGTNGPVRENFVELIDKFFRTVQIVEPAP